MGSWHQTCMLTRVPIMAGEKVKTFFLEGRRYVKNGASLEEALADTSSGDCYSTDTWHPISIPFDAEYNDYGAVENWDNKDLNVKFHSDFFNKHNKEPNLAKVLSNIHDNECGRGIPFYRIDDSLPTFHIICPYAFAMVPVSIYNKIVKEMGEKKEYWASNEEFLSETEKAQMKEWLYKDSEKWHEAREKHQLTIREYFTKRIDVSFGIYEQNKKDNIPERSSLALLLVMGKEFVREMTLNEEVIKTLMQETDGVKKEKLRNDLIDFMIFNCAMGYLRTSYGPQCGQGSQCSEYELHVARNEIAAEFCREKIRENEEYARKEAEEDAKREAEEVAEKKKKTEREAKKTKIKARKASKKT